MMLKKSYSFMLKFAKISDFDPDDVVKAKTDERTKVMMWEDNKPFFVHLMNRFNIDEKEQQDYLQEFWPIFDKAIQSYEPGMEQEFAGYLNSLISYNIQTM